MNTIKLQHPFTLNGEEIVALTLRRPKVRDRLIAEKSQGSEVEKEIRLIANLCEVAPDCIENLDMADYMACQETLGSFFS